MRRITFIVAALLLPAILSAQLTQQWVAEYDHESTAGTENIGWDVAVDGSGNVYVTGPGGLPGSYRDYVTIKYSPATGETLWVRYYNGSFGYGDEAKAIAVDNAGNVYVTGTSQGQGTGYDYATVKYSANGDEQWVARYDGPSSGNDGATAIALDGSGNVYVAGHSTGPGTYLDYATIKYTADGVQQWAARYDGPAGDKDYVRAIAVDAVGDVYVTGYSRAPGAAEDYATIKYRSSDGNPEWVARYNGPGNGSDVGTAVAVDGFGNAYVTGQSAGSGTGDDCATVKYRSSDGYPEWVARYNGSGSGSDAGIAIAVTASGYAYVTGSSQGSGTDWDYVTVKYRSSDGYPEWVTRYDGPAQGADFAWGMVLDASGDAYVTGRSTGSGTGFDYATLKYNASDGSICWTQHGDGAVRYDSPAQSADQAWAIVLDASGNAYVTGQSSGVGPAECDIATVKYDSGGDEIWVARHAQAFHAWDRQGKAAVDALGNVFVAGNTGPYANAGQDYVTIRYDASTGETLWVRFYDGPDHDHDQTSGIAVDGSGNVYVAGTSRGSATSYDYATVKYNADGDQQWVARYDGPGVSGEWAWAIAVDGSGNAYVTGSSQTIDGSHCCATVKYNADGIQQWVARYNGPGSGSAAAGGAIAVDGSGNVYVAGVIVYPGASNDYMTIKYGPDGALQWVARYDGPSSGTDYATAIALDASGNAYVTGSSAGSGASDDYATVKYRSSDGTPEWVARYDGPAGGYDQAYAIAVDASSGAYVTGGSFGSATSYDYATVKYRSSDGNPEWVARYDGPSHGWDLAQAIAVDGSGNAYVTGYGMGSGTNTDYATIMYDGTSGSQLDCQRYDGPHSSSDLALSIATGPTGEVVVSGESYVLGERYNIVTVKYLSSGPDVGVAEIIEPSGLIDTLDETPMAMVHNFGALTCSFDAWFEIRDSATNSVRYLESATVTDLAPDDDLLVEFPLWDVPAQPEGRYYATAWTELEGDIDPGNDTARGDFAVEAKQQGPPAWTPWTDVPAGPQNRSVQHGSALATDPDGQYVFLLKGSNTCEFYRYDPVTTDWSELDAIPEVGRDNVPRDVKEGGTLAQVAGKFYATKGGNCLEFWEYDPAAMPGCRWTQKADVPYGGSGVHAGASATGVLLGTSSSYVYLLKASGTCEFYRYDVGTDNWQPLAPAPGGPGEEFKNGSSITFDGTDVIYALKGTANDFYAYSVAANAWLERAELPLGPRKKQAKGGAAVCYHLGNVYCIKGSNSQEFWVYNCGTDAWQPGPDVTLGENKTRVQDGGALVYCSTPRYLYATKGNCLEFWSYGRLSNVGVQSGEVVALDGTVKVFSLDVGPSVVSSRARVRYAVPKAGNVNLKLYDISGRCAAVLRNGWCDPGRYVADVDAKSLAQGIYLLKCETGDNRETRRLVIQH